MEVPAGVRQAVIAIWATIAVSAVLAVYSKVAGLYSEGEFFSALFISAFLCIIPYKLGNGSNASRYVYVVLSALTVLIAIGSAAQVKKLDMYISVMLLPVEAFIIFRLFEKEASAWFTKQFTTVKSVPTTSNPGSKSNKENWY
jgi:hypothetical protein